jgi:hypothetical protein
MKRSAYLDLFEEVLSAPYYTSMKEEEIHPVGAGSVGGIKLILDSHTMTNRIADYKKGSFKLFVLKCCFSDCLGIRIVYNYNCSLDFCLYWALKMLIFWLPGQI